jgi:hypothetical protein
LIIANELTNNWEANLIPTFFVLSSRFPVFVFSYRIIYKIVDEPLKQIVVLEIGHRISSYSELARILGQGK